MSSADASLEPPNPLRGEAAITVSGQARLLRPTFAALVAAEDELGSLFALVERAGEGQLRLTELTALFWHCLVDKRGISREELQVAVVATGLAGCAPVLRTILRQVLQGRP